jgi:hypothetical protein
MIGTKTSRAAPALFAAIALVAIAAASASSAAFAAPPALAGRAGLAVTSKSSAFSGVSQTGADVVISGAQQRRSGAGITGLQMGKVSAVGPFTPAVVALRAVVGEKKFNQIRGKVRSPADTRAQPIYSRRGGSPLAPPLSRVPKKGAFGGIFFLAAHFLPFGR